MNTTGADAAHRPAGLTRRAWVVALSAGLALSACGGSAATNGPGSTGVAGATGTPGSTGTASQEPGVTPGTGGPDGGTAFGAATTALAALDSYAFKVEVQTSSTAGSVTTASHQVYAGIVENKPDKASTFEQSDLDANGNVTNGTGIITIGDKAWISAGGPDGPWTEVPAAQAQIFATSMAAFRPEQMFGLYFAGLGGDFASAGSETKNGVDCTHYKGNQNVGALLGSIAGFQGQWSSDVWIANDGGYLVHSEAKATGTDAATGGSYESVVDITNPNSAGPVSPPPG